MKVFWSIVAVVAVVCLIGGGCCISERNGLVRLDETVNETWSQIDTQLQRRLDLIPNLINLVKRYEKHEAKVFTEVAEARAKMMQASTPVAKAEASAAMESSLARLLMVSEQYPQLKADTQYTRLMDEMAGTENRIAVARKDYNAVVKQYNAAIRAFPGSLFAPGLGLEKRDYYEPPASRKELDTAPKVDLD